jgi:hypothetical protein
MRKEKSIKLQLMMKIGAIFKNTLKKTLLQSRLRLNNKKRIKANPL